MLTGKYHAGQDAPQGTRLAAKGGLSDRYMTPENIQTTEELRTFAESRGRTLLELAFSWLAAHGAVSSVIAGATRPEQIDQNVNAVDWALSESDLEEISRITGGVPA